ncbi:MAG TPA: hypothetical protein VGM92_07925 [Candidatus Kapabacteria bacterium]|jgi:hypothetical protein
MRNTIILVLTLLASVPGMAQHHAATKFPLPPVGTMLVNVYYVTDSSNRLVPKSTIDPQIPNDTLLVVRSGIKLFGRSNCVVIAAKSHPDTVIMSYAATGDLYMRGGHDTVWSVMPFGMKPGKQIIEHLHADSGTLLGKPYYAPHNRTTQVVRHDTISVEGKVYDCIELLVDDIRLYENKNWEQGTRYWYAPELGYLVKLNMGWNTSYFLNQQLMVWQPPDKK